MCSLLQLFQSTLLAPRSGLAIIPQDPFLFSGSIRENLDPCSKVSTYEQNADTSRYAQCITCFVFYLFVCLFFSLQYSDDELWSALTKCHLHDSLINTGNASINISPPSHTCTCTCTCMLYTVTCKCRRPRHDGGGEGVRLVNRTAPVAVSGQSPPHQS